MSNPVRQHFIPQSYLRNFAKNENGKYFVDALAKNSTEIKKGLSIKDICVEKNIYTFTGIETDKKYDLEKFYATNVDAVYPEVYSLLTNPDIDKIDSGSKAKIILTISSLFFRTPKFLNYKNKNSDDIYDHLANFADKTTGEINYKFKGSAYNFNINEIGEVKQAARLKNKEQFLVNHLSDWNKFVHLKMDCGISVIKIVDEIDLITSDNPVAIRAMKTNYWEVEDIFDPNNMIQIPLDKKHFLYIYPNSEKELKQTFWRSEGKLWNALTCNHEMADLSEKWILGFPGSIEAHISNTIKYNEETIENEKSIEDEKQRALLLQELYDLQVKHSFFHPLVIKRFIEIAKMEVFNNNTIIGFALKEYEKWGIKIKL